MITIAIAKEYYNNYYCNSQRAYIYYKDYHHNSQRVLQQLLSL